MLEDKRKCACCQRVTEWSERVIHCSDQSIICFNCLKIANLCEPPIKESGKVMPYQASFFLDRIRAHIEYDEFCNKKGTKALLGGHLLVNEIDHTFAVGSNSYDEMLIGFQTGSYESIDSISINDGVQTKSIKVSEGDSGAAGALFGGLIFGPLGAIVGGLGTRENAQFSEIKQADNIGFTITHKNTAHDYFNVLDLCLNYNFVNFETQRNIYEDAKKLTIQICEELYKYVEKETPKSILENVQPKAVSYPATSVININPSNVEPTVTRIELFLEDKEWGKVYDYANAALDYFPTDYRLYLFLLFADYHVSGFEELANCSGSITSNNNYKKIIRFTSDTEVLDKLERCSSKALTNAGFESSYNKACQLLRDRKYQEAYKAFVDLGHYKDSEEKSMECSLKMSEYNKWNETFRKKRENLEKKRRSLYKASQVHN